MSGCTSTWTPKLAHAFMVLRKKSMISMNINGCVYIYIYACAVKLGSGPILTLLKVWYWTNLKVRLWTKIILPILEWFKSNFCAKVSVVAFGLCWLLWATFVKRVFFWAMVKKVGKHQVWKKKAKTCSFKNKALYKVVFKIFLGILCPSRYNIAPPKSYNWNLIFSKEDKHPKVCGDMFGPTF